MTTSGDDDAGKFVVANATPFLWKQSGMKDSGMSSWGFPREVKPGETVTATVAFQGGQDAHGEVSYQAEIEEGVSGDGNPTFTFVANKDGLTVVLPPAIRRDSKWFVCPPAPSKLAEVGWQKGCSVSFTLGALGGDHPNLRGGHTARNFHGMALAAPNSAPAGSGEHRDGRGDVFPKKGSSSGASGDRDGGGGGGGGGLGGFFGAVGGMIKAATDSMGDLLNDCGVGDKSRPGGGKGEGNWTAEWMKRYGPVLADLQLADMSIPGTHDSGTAKMHNPVVGPWASTQNLGLTKQLQAGVRCLDFRVGFVGAEDQRNDNVKDGIAVVHDKHRTTLSLRDALAAVKKFVQDHPTEVVLLDFHRFPGLGHGAPHEKAAKVVVETLGDVMIHPKHRNLPFGKLMSNQRGRVAVLWNAVEARNPNFWPGVKQAWNGADSLRSLHELAATELAEKKRALWSMPLVLPAGVPRPVPHIPEELDEWIVVGGVWQNNASILAVDFVEETQLIRNCVGACMLKAARHSASSPAPAHGGGKKGGGGGGGGGGHKKK